MAQKINPTRMELMKLKKRHVLALRGHKLLRDKQEELMRRFMLLVNNLEESRKEVEKELVKSFQLAAQIGMSLPESTYKNFDYFQNKRLELTNTKKRIMNLTPPHYEITTLPDPYIYSLVNTSFEVGNFARVFKNVLPKLIALAELEASFVIISDELEKTRRRVNALEYVLIPSIEETIKYIEMKLSELERSTLVRLMRVKELLQQQ